MPKTSRARLGACQRPTSTHWTSTVLRSRGSTCAAIRNIERTGRGGAVHPSSDGACDSAADPLLDAREAQPLWITATDALMHVRASTAYGASAQSTFDLWRVPGRKRLTLGGAGLTLRADVSAQHLRMSLAADLMDGAAYAVTVPLGPGLRGQLDAFNAQAQALEGHVPAAASARAASRAALLHLRALQALDGLQAGASHRDIAQALFGLEAVALHWQADGELRALVRHLLRRAEAYMRGGYLVLASVVRSAAQPPGGEAMR